VFRIFDEHTGAPVEGLLSKVLQTRGGIRRGRHTVLLTQSGRRVPLDDRAALICLPGGEPFGVVVVFRDLTKSKSAESAEALLASIIASADDAIVSKTLDGQITSWNIGASRLFGYTAEEIVGKPITTIIPPELRAEEQEIIRRIRNGDHIEHFETSRVAKNGQRVDVSLTVSPIRDESGAIIGASKIARDIGPRKRAEALLRESDRRKDQFLAMLSHELRNPLAPIRYAASLLSRNIHLTPEAHAATEVINRQVRHLTHLVDDLLDVSRITTGRIRLKVELLDLVSVITLAVASYRPLLEADHIELSCDCPRGPIYVRGDRTRLAQVFSNILGNAGKYTPSGGVVRVSVRRELSEVLVSIRDTGVGIPSEMLKQVFDLFTQVDSTYEHIGGGGGLGIGLTIAKRLVEMHRGQIEAHSEGTNKGTEFVVRLPIAEATGVLEPIEAPKERTPVVMRRVLIADDNRDAADSLGSILRVLGHDVRIAYDGVAALEVADEFHPDVVLLDIGMPRLDGYETVQQIAARSWAKGTLRVALTGWGQSSDRERARAAGFHRHLVKPVDPEVLTEILSLANLTPFRELLRVERSVEE
jgi:two-component system CheB/CheR fusion protein